jgi:hypothetical protein
MNKGSYGTYRYHIKQKTCQRMQEKGCKGAGKVREQAGMNISFAPKDRKIPLRAANRNMDGSLGYCPSKISFN